MEALIDSLISFLTTLNNPIVNTVLLILGSVVVIGTFIDAAIPDEKDGGFMTKLFNIPVLGKLLEALKKFSPFNTKPKEPKE